PVAETEVIVDPVAGLGQYLLELLEFRRAGIERMQIHYCAFAFAPAARQSRRQAADRAVEAAVVSGKAAQAFAVIEQGQATAVIRWKQQGVQRTQRLQTVRVQILEPGQAAKQRPVSGGGRQRRLGDAQGDNIHGALRRVHDEICRLNLKAE